MAQVSREKIALIVFLACLALIAGGISAYMVAGHNWNYAASRIDDAAGEMDGYRIVLFEGTAIPARPRVDSRGMLDEHPVSLAAARTSYREKGATVFSIDARNPQRYDEPIVCERDGYRVGIVHLPSGTTPLQANEKTAYLVRHGCAAVVALSRDASFATGVDGVDIVVDLGSSRAISGAPQDGAYRVQSPIVGRVGAIVISPSEVVSARAVSSL